MKPKKMLEKGRLFVLRSPSSMLGAGFELPRPPASLEGMVVNGLFFVFGFCALF